MPKDGKTNKRIDYRNFILLQFDVYLIMASRDTM